MRIVSKPLSLFFKLAAIAVVVFSVYLLATGSFPFLIQLGNLKIKLKHLQPAFLWFLGFSYLSMLFAGNFWGRLESLEGKIDRFAAGKKCIWVIFSIYAVLFVWHQITHYLGLRVNFLDFSFYDYALYSTLHGKFMFAGDLHDWFFKTHFCPVLVLLLPLYYVFQNTFFLICFHGILMAFSAVPLFCLVRARFKEPIVPLAVVLVYLNSYYMLKALDFNFHVEAFYPLAIFSVFYFAFKGKRVLFFLCLIAGLMIKEDAPIYFSLIAVYFFIFQKSRRILGISGLAVCLIYYFIAMKIMFPAFAHPLEGSAPQMVQTFFSRLKPDLDYVPSAPIFAWAGYGKGFLAGLANAMIHPINSIKGILSQPLFFKLFKRLLFIPFFSVEILILLPLLLVSAGSVQYGLEAKHADVLFPLAFIALTFAIYNISLRTREDRRKNLLWFVCFVLFMINFGRFYTVPITRDTLKTISVARTVPAGKNIITMGNLVPHVSYRPRQLYFNAEIEPRLDADGTNPFGKADYYYIVKNMNTYPATQPYLDEKIREYKRDKDLELIYSDEDRWLFERK